jgi:hypothetical protein
MTGFLRFDRTDKPKDTLPRIDKGFYDFSKMDFAIKDPLYKPLVSEKIADPAMNNAPVTIAKIKFGGSSKKRKALRKKLNFKEQLPESLKKIFGEHFFLVRLKIPKEKHHHFLEYCNPLGIEELYKSGKHLDILKILLKESKSYLLLLENNK